MWNLLAAFENLTPMNTETILKALTILWQGLLAIFVVIALIILVVKLTSLCIAKAEESKRKKLDDAQNTQNQ